MRRLSLIWLCLALLVLPGLLPDAAAPTASAQDMSRILNNKTYVGAEADFVAAFQQAVTYEVNGDPEAALDIYERLLAQAERWLVDPPEGQEPRVLMCRVTDYETAMSGQGEHERDCYGQKYEPLETVCLRQIAELPVAVRDPWRQRIAPEARALFIEALSNRDRALLQRVADRYWLAPIGARAADLAANLAWEAGDFQVALHYWDRMRMASEATWGNDPQRMVRIAAAAWQVGDLMTFGEIRREALRKFDGFPATLGSLRVANLMEAIDDRMLGTVLFGRGPWAEPRGLQRPGGNDRRSRPSPSFGRMGDAWRFTALSGWVNLNDRGRGEGQRNQVNFMPACLDGQLIVQGPRQGQIMLLREPGEPGSGPMAGSPLARTVNLNIEPFLRNNRRSNTVRLTSSVTFGPAIWNDRLYCVFHPGLQNNIAGGNVLACFNLRENGAVEWVTPSGEADDPNADVADHIADYALSPAPAFNNGMLYLGASMVEGREIGYEVMAFDAMTGELRWTRKVASRLSDQMNFGRGGIMADEIAPITVDHGLVLFQTNAGVVVALDGLTGAVRWTFRYKRPENSGADPFNRGVEQTPSHWFNNAPVAHRGVGYYTPTDSMPLLAIENRTGEFLRAWPPGDQQANDLEYLLGVSDDTLHIQGRTSAVGLDLRYDHPLDLQDGEIANSLRYRTVDYSANQNELIDPAFVLGRGVLTTDAVMIPTRRGIARYNARTGKREVMFMQWPAEVMPDFSGHLFVISQPDGISPPDSQTRLPAWHTPPIGDVNLPMHRVDEPDGPTVRHQAARYLLLLGRNGLTLIETSPSE